MEGSFRFFEDLASDEGTRVDEYRAMTRCECAEISFDAVARRMEEKGLTLEEACERTGCGRICSACVPDLRAHLRRAR